VESELTPVEIQRLALGYARQAGEPNPSDVNLARGSFAKAQAAMEPSAGSGMSVAGGGSLAPWASSGAYLVVMHGDFTPNVPAPRGRKLPTGSVMGLILGAEDGAMEGLYIGETEPNVASVGPVIQLGQVPVGEAAQAGGGKRGVIVGQLLAGGYKRSRRHAAAKPVKGWQVIVGKAGKGRSLVANAEIVARATTGGDGRFSISVRPGRYLVAGRWRTSGAVCGASYVDVREGRVSRVKLGCGPI
jgi:hypothetical protein